MCGAQCANDAHKRQKVCGGEIMLDVWGVAASAVWVIGAAMLLATLSEAVMRAHNGGSSVRCVLQTGGYRTMVSLGMALFCAGMAATEARIWARWLWLALTGAFLVELIGSWRRGRRAATLPSAEDGAP